MVTIYSIEKDDLAEVLELMKSKGCAELSYGDLRIKMQPADETPPQMSPEQMKEFQTLSKIPTDEEILMDYSVGLPEGGFR